MSKDNGDIVEFVTHEQWKIIMLMAHGHAPIDVRTGPIEGSRSKREVLLYVFDEEARDLSDAWDRGDDHTDMMEAVRLIENLMDMFKRNIRRML